MIDLQRTDTGVQFICTIKDKQTGQIISLVGATNIQFIFRQPDRKNYVVNGSLYTDGSDGKVVYTSQSTDINIAGLWKLQVSYTITTYTKLTSWITFQVEPNLSDLT